MAASNKSVWVKECNWYFSSTSGGLPSGLQPLPSDPVWILCGQWRSTHNWWQRSGNESFPTVVYLSYYLDVYYRFQTRVDRFCGLTCASDCCYWPTSNSNYVAARFRSPIASGLPLSSSSLSGAHYTWRLLNFGWVDLSISVFSTSCVLIGSNFVALCLSFVAFCVCVLQAAWVLYFLSRSVLIITSSFVVSECFVAYLAFLYVVILCCCRCVSCRTSPPLVHLDDS